MQAEELCPVYQEIELPLIEVLASMEKTGIRADGEELEEIGVSLKEQIDKITAAVYESAGEEFNINSPKQLGSILFDKLKLPPGKKTKSGYSTNAEVLEHLARDYEIAAQVLEFRMLTKLNGTYVEGMLPLIDSDSRIHAHFQQTVTTTGRLSCTEPNLQNIPVRQELGRLLRKVFTASGEGRILVGADYSQIELRIMAHLSQDPALIEAFEKNLDIHRSTAARVFDIPSEDVTPLQRSRAKAVNFGVIYGISAFGLSSGSENFEKRGAAVYRRLFPQTSPGEGIHGPYGGRMQRKGIRHHHARPQEENRRNPRIELYDASAGRTSGYEYAGTGYSGGYHEARYDRDLPQAADGDPWKLPSFFRYTMN